MSRPVHLTLPTAIITLALLLGMAGFAAADSHKAVETVAGTYDVTGVNRDGSTYTGAVEIADLGKRHYRLRWQDGDGIYEGQGALLWRQLFVVWGEEGADCLVVLYEVNEDGTLVGDWFAADDVDHRGSEEARPIGPRPAGTLEGTYSVVGSDPSGALYEEQLAVSALSPGFYRFQWNGLQSTLEGIGELDENHLVVVRKNAGQCGRMTYEIEDDGRLEGTWMMTDDLFEVAGRETAVPRKGSAGGGGAFAVAVE